MAVIRKLLSSYFFGWVDESICCWCFVGAGDYLAQKQKPNNMISGIKNLRKCKGLDIVAKP